MPDIKNDETKKLFKSVLFGTVTAICIAVIIMFLMAVLMLLAHIPTKYASVLSSIALAVGSMIGGRFSASKNGKKGLVCGALTALEVFLVITVIGMFLNDAFTVMTLIHFAVVFLAALIGGIFGVNKSEKRKVI